MSTPSRLAYALSDTAVFSEDDVSVAIGAALAARSLSLGSNELTAGSLIIGTSPAAAGLLRLSNAGWIAGRNAANSGDVNMWKVNANNYLDFGTTIYRDDFGVYSYPIEVVVVADVLENGRKVAEAVIGPRDENGVQPHQFYDLEAVKAWADAFPAALANLSSASSSI